MKRVLRSESHHWLVGSTISEILGSKLPINHLILKRYLFIRDNSCGPFTSTVRAIAKIIYDEIISRFWKPSRIPTKPEKSCLDQIVKLVGKYETLKKIPNNRLNDTKPQERIQQFVGNLKCLFDISHPNTYGLLEQSGNTRSESPNTEWKIDWDFLIGQRQVPQVGCMDGVDKILDAKERQRKEREDLIEQRKQKELDRIAQTTAADDSIDSSTDGEGKNIVDLDSSFEHEMNFTSETDVVLQRDLITPTSSAALRMGLSTRQHTVMLASFVNSVSGSTLSNVTLSVGSVHQKRSKQIERIAKEVRQSYIPPRHGTIHFDSKIFSMRGGLKEDRVAIVFSPPPKILSICSVLSSSGLAQKDACIQALTEWNLQDNVVAAVYDTTASNSGAYNGATVLLEQELGHPLLNCPCRRHIAECHIKRTQKKLRGPTTGPTYKLFSRFKDDYNSFQPLISPEEYQTLDYDELNPFMTSQANEVKEWAGNCLKNDVFPREDYKELCELMAVFLGADLSTNQFKIRRPGADHHARFMAKAIYYLKIHLPQKFFHLRPKEVKEIKRMAIYIAVFYGKYFLQSSLTSSAPFNDLRFLCFMHQYSLVDKEAGIFS